MKDFAIDCYFKQYEGKIERGEDESNRYSCDCLALNYFYDIFHE